MPAIQAFPAECKACGVILARVQERYTAQRPPTVVNRTTIYTDASTADSVDVEHRGDWRLQALICIAFSIWSFFLIRMDYKTGEIGNSFIHRPLLIFHEAGHVLFGPFGEWVKMLGGSLMQLIMPILIVYVFWVKQRDRFAAAIGGWFFGLSLIDIAPYMYDALAPQLMLITGGVGEDAGHDWIYLFKSLGLLHKAQIIGGITHTLGSLLMVTSLSYAAYMCASSRSANKQ